MTVAPKNEPVILITGGGSVTALVFTPENATLVVSGRRAEVRRALADRLRSLGEEAEFTRQCAPGERCA
jgi:NADP-dependent 3-hydroxy acid dehydrogenase YdfG